MKRVPTPAIQAKRRAVELAEAKDATIKELRTIVENQGFDIDVRLHAAQILLSVQDLG